MPKDDFEQHFERSMQALTNLTGQYCYNTISENYRYTIEPSGEDYHDAMTVFGKQQLDNMLSYKNSHLTKRALLGLLYVDDKIPNWINISVYESRQNKTVVHILATREWRTYEEAIADFPKRELFHAVVPLPPEHLKKEIDGKFDVNWKKNLDDGKSGNAFVRLRHFFRNLF